MLAVMIVVRAGARSKRHAALMAAIEQHLQRLDPVLQHVEKLLMLRTLVVLQTLRLPVNGESLFETVLLEDIDAAVGDHVRPAAQ